jgi:hypothetical protein
LCDTRIGQENVLRDVADPLSPSALVVVLEAHAVNVDGTGRSRVKAEKNVRQGRLP